MSLLQRLQEVVKESSDLMLDSNRTLRRALGEIHRSSPTYTADKLVRDVSSTWVKWLLLGMKLSRPLSDPLLPTVTITQGHGSIVGNLSLSGTVSMAESVPLGTNPVVTPLVFFGWSVTGSATSPASVDVIPMVTPVPDSDMDPLRQQLTVRIDGANVVNTPEQGSYQGFAMIGNSPIALVVLRSL